MKRKYTLMDAIRMGFNLEQVEFMAQKISEMPEHHRFPIGPIRCSDNQKIVFRLEKGRDRYGATVYRLFDDEINRQRICAKDPIKVVYGILKMTENWKSIMDAHYEVLAIKKSKAI